MKEYTIDNINEFFEDLMNKPNAKINMLNVYGAYERECEDNKRKQEIRENFKFGNRYYIPYIVNDDIAIVEEQKGGKTTGFFPYVGNKRSYCFCSTFEQALLCAVSIKLTGREDATEWMWKLVGGDRCV